MRSSVTLFAIVFGCTAVIFSGGFFEDVYDKLRENDIHSHTGHLQIYRRGFLQTAATEPFSKMIENAPQIQSALEAVPGVVKITQEIQFSALLSNGENAIACSAWGRSEYKNKEHVDQFKSGTRIISGQGLDDTQTDGIELGKGLAESINAKVGSELILLSRTGEGSLNGRDVVVRGIFTGGSKEMDDYLLRLPLSTAQALVRTEGVQSILVTLDDTRKTEAFHQKVQELIKENGWDVETRLWSDASDFYFKTRALFGRWFLVLRFVIGIIVILSIYNTMNMVVMERTVEIGTLMALGAKRKRVIGLIMTEGLVLGVLGGLLGTIVGSFLTLVVAKIGIPMPPPPGFSWAWTVEPLLVPSILVFSFSLSIITAALSSLWPAFKASRLEIAQALRYTT